MLINFNVDFQLECCGYNNYTDWSNEAWHFNGSFVPLSCCKPENPSSNASNVTCTGSIMRPELIYTRVRYPCSLVF